MNKTMQRQKGRRFKRLLAIGIALALVVTILPTQYVDLVKANSTPPYIYSEMPINTSVAETNRFTFAVYISDPGPPDSDEIDWTIETSNGDNSSGFNVDGSTGTAIYCDVGSTALIPYYGAVTVWVNATDDELHTASQWYNYTIGPPHPPYFPNPPSPANGSTNNSIDFNWSIVISDAVDVYNYTIECSNGNKTSQWGVNGVTPRVLQIKALEYSTTYTVWVNASCSDLGYNIPSYASAWFTFETMDEPAHAEVSLAVDPMMKEVEVGETFTVNITVDPTVIIDTVATDEITFTSGKLGCTKVEQGDLFNQSTFWMDGDIHNASGNITDIVWGSHTPTSTPGTFIILTFKALAAGMAYINITANKVGAAYNMTARTTNITNNGTITIQFYIPEKPIGFDATAYNRTQIDLNWTKGTRADTTYIVGKIGSYPANMTDGDLIYNSTGISKAHADLLPGEHWYYRAWSWNETGNYFSTNYSEANATTPSNGVPELINEDPENESTGIDITLSQVSVYVGDLDGDLLDVVVVFPGYGSDEYYGVAANNTFTTETGLLDLDTIYYWSVSAYDGFDWTNATYHFTTRAAYVPAEPTDFNAFKFNRTQINMTWTPSIDADATYIEWNTTETWSIGQGTLLYNGTGSSTEHTGLLPGVRYYYQAWSYNGTDNVFSTGYASDDDKTGDNNAPELSSETPINGSLNIDVDYSTVYITIGDKDVELMDWTIHGPYISTASGYGSGNATVQASLTTPLPYDTIIYWYVEVTDGFNWTNATYHFQTVSDNPVIFSYENPLNNSIDVPIKEVLWNVTMEDPDGDNFDWTIECSGWNVSNDNYDSALGEINGSKEVHLGYQEGYPLSYATIYTIWVNATDGELETKAWYQFTTRDQYVPSIPSDFIATAYDRFTIDLSWTPDDDYTYIEWSFSPTWSRGAGNFLYNDTGSYTQDTGINPGDHVYYQAWSYNVTDNVYSPSYASADASSTEDQAPIISNEDPLDTSIDVDKNYPQVSVNINDPEGDSMSWTIEVSNGDDDFGIGVLNGTISCDLTTPLTYGAIYTWWVNVTDVYKATGESYTFTVRSEYTPGAPTSFTATGYSPSQINMTWSKGSMADKTYIERNSYQTWVMGIGTPIYNDTGSAYQDTGRSAHTKYFYQVWSWNSTDGSFSSSYAEGNGTTLNNLPNQITNERPVNNTPYTTVYRKYLNVTVSDPDGDSLTVYFKWQNGTTIAFTTVASGAVASIYLPNYINPDWLTHSTDIRWYVVVNDSVDQIQSPVFKFTTCHQADVDEDRDVDITDVSIEVAHYGEDLIAGSQPWDIVENGKVDVTDISRLVMFYGETF